MLFHKNIAFSSLIKLNGRLREFNFRKRSELLYDADTNNERGDRYFFKIEKHEGEWKIGGSDLPDWLTGNEILIASTIDKE